MQLISWDRELARERELRRQVTFAEALFEMENNTYIRGVLISHCRKLLHYSKVMLAFKLLVCFKYGPLFQGNDI